MPTYEYRCKACGHEFEEFQAITAEHLKKCPACGKRKLQRLIGAGAAVLFKGSGFYETDYRSKEYKEKAKADKPEGSSKSESSSDTSGGKKTSGNGGSTPDTSSTSKGEKGA